MINQAFVGLFIHLQGNVKTAIFQRYMKQAILVENLSKRFGDNNVVKGISFVVEEGEIFGFLGPNGAGKTTSIRMMIGELPYDGGRIEILGMPMPDERETIKKIIGVVPDHQNLYDRLTVRQNLDLFARLTDTPVERIDEVLALVNMKEHENVPTQKLSRGLRQRTLIARGILHKPQVFFLDEPTSALDPHSASAIRKLIRTMKHQGTTVLLTTHYMEEATMLCDRLAILHQGNIVAVDTPDSLRIRFGKANIAVTLKPTADEPEKRIEVPLNDEASARKIERYLSEGKVLKIHSQEATLEEVFMNLTGSQWKESDPGINQ